ncbi:hypothetical protein [Lentilactobacillus hilgardii]|uniref:Uncharacterized protein n=1 Tax=Lentilactobacillus hilgardii (strain ATCC 8290 / DSM 20176 / CCUG 30140 / JCM 1155 / KCTC 3500 / NBRC 15886 / NCIMB 8040 / NRRL B-1843 / 9) TaxID=1423757 RepID=C0XKA3_LENH9|nr:hypothetical protein [Lentilactobacillus hilgardii]EEI24181.1 hypothetical protein HMPREF0519_1664 [Lentilactobacillus hilgardii DSM 20176 = ATCC 8290]KRK53721.1 hypothetical protein FD42_GL001646 [Lentilactobacillus hilgardii DSM 20176 = ATCC 8290]MCP9333906.1 hypothetical protein [Lentilactobacillus hilgardii]MCP9350505.1 hypothetical protein [Lentilactobacillus hilgardii]MCP9353401.1 hypothetical protein [Lentilactobacillus hilgardii]
MEIKKLATGLVVASFIGIGVFSNPQQVSAATWHKGTPSALRGHWRTGIFHYGGFPCYDTLTVSKHMLNDMIHAIGSSADAAAPTIWYPKYRYLGNHLYKFKGMGIGGFKAHCWIKWRGHNSISVKTNQNKRVWHYYR